MPYFCCVLGCNSTYKSGPKVSLFKFPRNQQSRIRWLLAIHRKDFIVTEASKVCSLHFQESDFEREVRAYNPKNRKTTAPLYHIRLKKDAVPSLFNVSDHNKSLGNEGEGGVVCKDGKLSTRLQPSLASMNPESCQLKDTIKSNLFLENESRKNLKKKPSRKKRKGESEGTVSNQVNDSSVKCNVNNQEMVSSDNLIDKNHILLKSSTCLPAVSIKVEKPWEDGYNYAGKPSVDKSKDCDKFQIEIRDVRSVSSSLSEKPDENKAEMSESSSIFSRPLKVMKREEMFGKLVASELSDLYNSPELYLKTKRAILDILVQAQFELIKCSGTVL